MRSILLASLVMFATQGFANTDGNPTVDESNGAQSIDTDGGPKKAAVAVAKGLQLGLKKIGQAVLWVPQGYADSLVASNVALEYRDFEGGETQSRLVWSLESKGIQMDDDHHFGASKIVLTASAEEFPEDWDDINAEIVEVSLWKVLTAWNIAGLDVDFFQYQYSKNNNLNAAGVAGSSVVPSNPAAENPNDDSVGSVVVGSMGIGSTESINIISGEYHSEDALGNDGWNTALGNVTVVAGAEFSIGTSEYSNEQGGVPDCCGGTKESYEFGGSTGLKLGLNNGVSVTGEVFAAKQKLVGQEIETFGAQLTLEKAGNPFSLSLVVKEQDIDGVDSTVASGQINYAIQNGHKGGSGIPDVPGKK